MPPVPADGPGRAMIVHFERKAAQQHYTLSSGQWQVIDALARRTGPLLEAVAGKVGVPQSLYLYGKVGRGKSWLLDTFFQAVPIAAKRRVHFHVFFNQLHQGMFRHRESRDALGATLNELLQGCRLLCFDEFHVHDIGDAMLMTRLFKALFERGVLLIVTSNYPPLGLLPNPLYHERFLPVIRLINSDMQVQEVGGEQDYRALPSVGSGQRFTQGRYVWPGDAAQRQALGVPASGPGQVLQVGQRRLRVQAASQGFVRFTFSELFEQATAVMDYLALCDTYDDWTIDQLPLLDDCTVAVQQRFINLVDVLYDQDKRLTLISAYPLAQALQAKAIDLMRSQSRLSQLQPYGPLESPRQGA
nr:cell division protein ZapE [Pseudomonas typographi]